MSGRRFILWSLAVVAALWMAEAATLLLPCGDHLMWQLDSWLFWLDAVATLALTMEVTIVVGRHRHLVLQVLCWMVWLLNLLGMLVVFLVLAVCIDRLPGEHRWEEGRYLVRCSDMDSNQVLYERRGIVEHRLYMIWYAWPDAVDNYSIRTCNEHDMLLMECDDYYGNRDRRLLHLDGSVFEGDIDDILCTHLASEFLHRK